MRQIVSAKIAEGSDLVVTVVDAPDEGILIAWTPTGLVDVLVHDVVEVDERVLHDARHEHVPGPLYGRVERHGEGELLGFVGKPLYHGNDAAGRDCEVACADACPIGGVEPAQGREGLRVVRKGLALAHEDGARNAVSEVITHMHDLLVYLACRKRAREAGHSRRTEGTADATTCLARGTDGESFPGGHAHAFDAHTIGKAQEVLSASVRGQLPHDLLCAVKRHMILEHTAQRLWKIGHLVQRRDILVPDPLLDLPHPEGGLSQLPHELLQLSMGHAAKVELPCGSGAVCPLRAQVCVRSCLCCLKKVAHVILHDS